MILPSLFEVVRISARMGRCILACAAVFIVLIFVLEPICKSREKSGRKQGGPLPEEEKKRSVNRRNAFRI